MNKKHQFNIHTSASSILIENTFIKQFIGIERDFYPIYHLQSMQNQPNNKITSSIAADGILGIIDIDYSKYLLIICESRSICQLFEEIEVKSIKTIDLILISSKEANPHSKDLIRKNLMSLLTNGFYYSNGYDLTRSLQEKESNTSKSNTKTEKATNHSMYTSNKDYMWNYQLIQTFFSFNIDERFLSCCIYGYVVQIAKTIQSLPLEFTLISKRLTSNYSLYGRDKGLMEMDNHKIYCHNFVETECITQMRQHIFSLVMYSSSIPVYENDTRANLTDETCKHFGFYINNILVKKKEVALMTFFHKEKSNKDEAILKQLLEKAIWSFKSPYLKYIKFNTTSTYDYDLIVKDHSQICNKFGFYWKFPNRIVDQQGIYYLISNKLSNSESSNELLASLAWHCLSKQLSSVIYGFNPLGDLNKVAITQTVNLLELTDFNKEGNNNQSNKEKEELRVAFKEMWSKHRKALDYEQNPPANNRQSQIVNQKIIDYLLDDGSTTKRKYSKKVPLNIFIGSMNCAGIDPLPSYDLSPWFNHFLYHHSSNNSSDPDLILIGMQEIVELNVGNIVINSNEENVKKWNELIYKGIIKAFPNVEYIPIKKMDLVGILLVCFIKKGLDCIVKDSLIIKTGALGTMGNKGSCLFSLNYLDTSIAFATGHFCAGQKKVNERIAELNELRNTPLLNSSDEKVPFKQFADWFIFGDINFRVDLEYNDAISHLKQKDIEYLLRNDQLNCYREKKFSNLNESPITFMPTYQYKFGFDEFESKKLRIPSWCDRILYNSDSKVRNIEYNIVNEIKYSDHRPIYAIFERNCTQMITNERQILLHEMSEFETQMNPVFFLENAYISNYYQKKNSTPAKKKEETSAPLPTKDIKPIDLLGLSLDN